MNIKRNIIFALESRKKNSVPIVENVPIRMRVIYVSQRIEFTTGYRIDVAKWDADKQRVKVRGIGNHAYHPTAKGCVQSTDERFQ